MDNRGYITRLAAVLVMTVFLLVCACAASAETDPIRVSSLSEPQSVISEQDVNITIKIYNSSQTDMEGEIRLYKPDRYLEQVYNGLKAENSVTYTGVWHITADEIQKGRINYYIKYTIETDEGPTEVTHTIPVTIQTEEAAPQLTATYSVSPASAREGQSVTFSYTLANTGNIELRNIEIANEGVTSEKVTVASLSVGEKITQESTITMGSKELVSKPTVTYQAAGSDKSLTISDMARKTITVAEDGLEVTLSAKTTENIYPGEIVDMTLTLKNSGNTAYSGLSASLSDGTALVSGVDLAPGASYEHAFEQAIAASGALSAIVTGSDSTGEAVTVESEAVTLTTQDASRALVLNIQAQAQTTTIYSEPAVIRFGVVVENVGQTDATTLTIRQAGTTVATIPSLPSGESRTVVFDVQTSIAGQFQFTVTGKDAAGNDRTYESNIIQVNYIAPTPAPTATPRPTSPPPTPTPVPTPTPKPTLGQIISGSVNPVVLYTIAGVLAAVLIALLAGSAVSKAKRAKREQNAIDTIELTPDVRNHRGLRRRGGHAEKKADGKKPEAEESETIVPTPELTEEDTWRAKPDAGEKKPEPEEGRRRRAAVDTPVTAERTLRVAPVDQRPEFPQSKADDSRTRIFGKLTEEALREKDEPEKPEAAPAPKAETSDAPEKRPLMNFAAKAEEQPETAKRAGGETIRLSREELDALRKKQADAAPEAKGRKRSEIKPMKKKKKGLFGRHKDDDMLDGEDDFVDMDDEFDDSDDDFIE